MSDKYLTESEWKSFCKNPAYKDTDLRKALLALEKADKAGPDECLKALAGLKTQADKLLAANKGDKVLATYLDKMEAAALKLRKDAEGELAKDKAKAKDQEGEDEEPDSALLDSKKLLYQLNLCKRDPERTVEFAFVDGKDKQDAVFALSPKLSGKKMFATLQTETGVKTGAFGSAWIDGDSLMLQLDKPLSGLVKKVRAPVKACGFRIAKVVLWNADGTVFEQDSEQDGPLDAPAGADKAAAPGASSNIPPAPPLPPGAATKAAAPATAVSPEQTAFNSRLAALIPLFKAAKEAGLPNVQDINLKLSEAGMLARKHDFASANALLDEAERLLKATGAGSSTPASNLVGDWKAARAQWQDANELVDEQLNSLRAAILVWLNGRDDEVDEFGEAMREIADKGLNSLTKDRRVKLMAALMDLGSGEPAALKAKGGAALQQIRVFEEFLQSSEQVASTDDNPLDVPVSIRATLLPPLRQMAAVLESAQQA